MARSQAAMGDAIRRTARSLDRRLQSVRALRCKLFAREVKMPDRLQFARREPIPCVTRAKCAACIGRVTHEGPPSRTLAWPLGHCD